MRKERGQFLPHLRYRLEVEVSLPEFDEFLFMHCTDGAILYGKYVKKKIIPVRQAEAWGITSAKDNPEQLFLMNLLLDDNIKLITAIGKAGSGKTLLSLAAGLEKVVDESMYNKMIVTRATIPFGRDIGYLPGGVEEKMTPWMKCISDNLEYITKGFATDKKGRSLKNNENFADFLKGKVELEALTFMRGRSFID